jgi:hypothetical protein
MPSHAVRAEVAIAVCAGRVLPVVVRLKCQRAGLAAIMTAMHSMPFARSASRLGGSRPMLLSRRRSQVAASLAIIAMFGGVSLSLGSRVEAPTIPDRIGDDVFWRMVSDYSEPGGFFRSDNFVSNEITFQWVLPELAKTTKLGGVYLGVGPDQNFTYIVAMQPKIAFIVDIRRQNMLHPRTVPSSCRASSPGRGPAGSTRTLGRQPCFRRMPTCRPTARSTPGTLRR